MWYQKESFLLKKNSRYHYVSLGLSIASSTDLRSSRGRLAFLVDLEKWKTSNLLCLITRPNWLKKDKIIL